MRYLRTSMSTLLPTLLLLFAQEPVDSLGPLLAALVLALALSLGAVSNTSSSTTVAGARFCTWLQGTIWW